MGVNGIGGRRVVFLYSVMVTMILNTTPRFFSQETEFLKCFYDFVHTQECKSLFWKSILISNANSCFKLKWFCLYFKKKEYNTPYKLTIKWASVKVRFPTHEHIANCSQYFYKHWLKQCSYLIKKYWIESSSWLYWETKEWNKPKDTLKDAF